MQEKKVFTVFWIFAVCFSVLLLRLMHIALYKGEVYSQTAGNQQTYSLTLAKRRGYIYDSNGETLNYDERKFYAVVSPSYLKSKYVLYSHGASEQEVDEKLKSKKPFSVEVNEPFEADGVTVVEADAASSGICNHIIGYVNADGDGVSGIEKNFNDFLRKSGGEVEAKLTLSATFEQLGGTAVSVFSQSYENKGGVVLTIDKTLQKIVCAAADKYVEKGAVVVTDREGNIKALVSRPDYDPSNVSQYLDSDEGELVNRALQSYNIGSVFKIITSSAALENGTYPDEYECGGSIAVGNISLSCHKKDGHGRVDLKNAFMQSCNPYFIECGLMTGYDNIITTARSFGLGKEKVLCGTVIGSRANLTGSLVTDGLTANISIGQGDILITPLDAASLVLTIVNGGEYTPLRLVKGILNNDGSFTEYFCDESKYRAVSEETALKIKQMMIDTVDEGTGTSAKPDNMTAGGKTASAETGWKNGEVHGWFVGFFPAEDPEYIVSIVVENGRSGSTSAAPCFKEIANEVDNLKSE